MLDFEARKPLPAIYEIAQLIEDYPLAQPDGAGWDLRLGIVRRYFDQLARFGFTVQIDDTAINKFYDLFALERSLYGLGRQAARPSADSSTGSWFAYSSRVGHWRQVIYHLAHASANTGIQTWAAIIAQAMPAR